VIRQQVAAMFIAVAFNGGVLQLGAAIHVTGLRILPELVKGRA